MSNESLFLKGEQGPFNSTPLMCIIETLKQLFLGFLRSGEVYWTKGSLGNLMRFVLNASGFFNGT